MMSKLSQKKIAKLLDLYETLSNSHKQVLEIHALCGTVFHSLDLVDILSSKEFNYASSKKQAEIKLADICSDLQQYGYFKYHHSKVYPEINHAICVAASSSANPRSRNNIMLANELNDLDVIERYGIRYVDSVDMFNLLNIALYNHDSSRFDKLFKLSPNKVLDVIDSYFFSNNIDMDWLATRTPKIQALFTYVKLSSAFCCSRKSIDYNNFIKFYQNNNSLRSGYEPVDSSLVFINIFSGNIPKAIEQMRSMKIPPMLADAVEDFFAGKYDSSYQHFRSALTAIRKKRRKKSWVFIDIYGVLYLLLLLYHKENIQEVSDCLSFIAQNNDKNHNARLFDVVKALLLLQQGDKKAALMRLPNIEIRGNDFYFYGAFVELAYYIIDLESFANRIGSVENILKNSIATGQLLAAHICEELLQRNDNSYQTKNLLDFKFFDLIKVKESWEHKLNNIERFLLPPSAIADSSEEDNIIQDRRLAWLLNPNTYEIQPYEQNLGKTGWSKGRLVSLKRLYHERSEFDYLTKQDNRVLDYLSTKYSYLNGSSSSDFEFDKKGSIRSLVDHPVVFHANNNSVHLSLIATDPEIYIEPKGSEFKISLSHTPTRAGFTLEQEGSNKFRYIDFSSDYIEIAKLITSRGIKLPSKAKDRVVMLIKNAKKEIKIHSGIDDVDIPIVESDATPLIQLLPVDLDIQLNIWMKPFKEHGGYCKAGNGRQDMIAIINDDGKESKIRTKRDLSLEKSNVDAFIKSCPSINSYQVDDYQFAINSPEDILETISRLEELKLEDKINIEWPKGQTYHISNKLNSASLNLNIKSKHNWFEYDGEVQVAADKTIEIRTLLELLDHSPSRFVQMNNGEFIELTVAMRKRLQMLSDASSSGKVYNLNSSILQDIATSIDNVTVDKGWENHLKKIKKMNTHNPQVPSTLQAELRDYQIDGFKYLSTLANWEIGACLADDMGLGKTIQSIALILEQASKGATLVIAPTSLCFNWQEELAKFAPSLNVYSMYSRKKSQRDYNKMDVVICSYGFLQHNEDLISKVNWQTIIIDEAQAIKNPGTKRWKSVMSLKGKVRIALTGTPIENHLGELWSIFNFINPGILGNLREFTNNFANPIESGKNKGKIATLKEIVKPYILRRLKSEVLTELPPKIEQTIHIEPSMEELAFYNAVREKAIDKIAEAGNDRIAILAEITKLRLACCDSSLVDSNINIQNSKLKYFINTLNNIIDNGHKVLVFSQYVGFLTKVKDLIEQENISYQYIDGSTNQAKRKKSVEEFQSGKGDVFLLSLKAGGSGLNLTAADYVIHLDPWWNPAVEDQASDRAHRIGQDRAVTIYRLVMKDTIEDKIIYMHKNKRDLANNLLEGQGIAGKMSEKDLLNLMSA